MAKNSIAVRKGNLLVIKLKRQESRERSRQLLIDATLNSLADIGLARTSVTEIVERANLSRGMVHLHFSSKNRLIEEAAKHTSALYFQDLGAALSQTGNAPQEQLEAIVINDLSEKVLNERSIRIWFALRGEASVSQAIARYSDTRDEKLNDLVLDAFLEIAAESRISKPGACARDATHGTLALLEGMWTDYFLHSDSFNRDTARRIAFRFLSGLFPDHFNLHGAVRAVAAVD